MLVTIRLIIADHDSILNTRNLGDMDEKMDTVQSDVDYLRRTNLTGQYDTKISKGFMFPTEMDFINYPKLPKQAMRDYVEDLKRREHPEVDYIHMDKFLKLNAKQGLPNMIAGLPTRAYLPNGHTLIDLLNDDLASEAGGWRYPSGSTFPMSNSQGLLTASTLKEVKVMEVTVSEHIPNIDEFYEFVTSNFNETTNSMPIQFISMTCEKSHIPHNSDTEKLSKPELLLPGERLYFPAFPKESQSSVELPMKLVFGDGIKWMGVISFPYNDYSPSNPQTRNIIINRFKADQRLAKVINALPVMVGKDVKQDVQELLTMFNFYQIEANLENTVDIGVLALLAGWNVPDTSLFVLHLVTTGCMLNKEVSLGDHTWHLKYGRIQPSLKVYIIGDIRASYLATAVLLSILVRDMFPDPDAICSTLSVHQKDAFSWLTDMILNATRNLELKPPSAWTTYTRLALATNIIINDQEGVPKDYRLLCNLIPNRQLSITSGGPRFLHSARSKFEQDYETLKMMTFNHPSITVQLHDLSPEVMESHIRYGRPVTNIDQGHPVHVRGLTCHPDLAETVIQLHDSQGDHECVPKSRLAYSHIVREAIRTNRDPVDLIREYCRVYPKRIEEIMTLLNSRDPSTQDYEFWTAHSGCYSEVKRALESLMDC